jgi:hypothetical protein
MDLQSATDQDLKRLLELYPLDSLRSWWPEIKGKKDEICFTAAQSRDYERIAAFVQENFSCCKQHVYAFAPPAGEQIALPGTIRGEAATVSAPGGALFVLRVRYEVVLRDPLEEIYIDFLWPLRLEITDNQQVALLRLVVLEKGVSQFIDRGRPYYVPGRTIEERDVLNEVDGWAGGRIDLHKGIKALWAEGFMDSPQAKLKKALSVATEIMDEELGIREHNPELYEQIADNTLVNALFTIADKQYGATAFSAQPSSGYLAFPRYSEKGGTDRVISEILANNK